MRHKTALGDLVRSALSNAGKNQEKLALDLQITTSELSDFLNGKRPASEEVLVRIANSLSLDAVQLLLAESAIRCGLAADKSGGERREWLRAGQSKLEQLLAQVCEANREVSVGERDFVSLETFPNLVPGKWSIITGDRRETSPKGFGDILALSASSSDLMYLLALGLPPETVVYSDKILRIAKGENIRRLLACNLLVIGSPAVSIATRDILRLQGATFLFNISERHYEQEHAICERVPEDQRLSADFLRDYLRRTDVEDEIDDLLATFRKPGFVDPVVYKDIRGRAVPREEDYGMIALSQNPWSSDHIVCICAGVHGPGTAGAMKMLADRKKFSGFPWGGILTVSVPDQAPWEERFRFLNPAWETHPYTPDSYCDNLTTMIESMATKKGNHGPMEVGTDVLSKVLKFAEKRLSRQPTPASGAI
jgi:transcriptional regulator with XRE-family HTH domain